MKGGITKRIEEITEALAQGQLKKALYLSEAKGLEDHHGWIEEAARTCLIDRDNKERCETAIHEARGKVQNTITLPIDDTSLEGLEEYLSPEKPPEQPPEAQPTSEKTDEELYEACEECHVAAAASRFASACELDLEEAGASCNVIFHNLEDENTEPVDWIRAMVQSAEGAKGKAKEEMVEAITELTDYLERRNSPLLKELEQETKA